MKACIQIGLATLMCLAAVTASFAQQPAKALWVDPDLTLMRSLPSVYMVRFFGVGEVSIPASVDIHLEGLDREFEQAVKAGMLSTDADRTEFKWQRLRRDPSAYLTPSQERLAARQDVNCWGTAFAISREGILLTNRHVVEDDKPRPLDALTVNTYAPEPFNRMAETLIDQVGGLPADPPTKLVTLLCLLDWFGEQSRQSGTYSRGEILLSYSKQNDLTADPTRLADRITRGLFGLDLREPVAVPVTIVAKGGDRYAEDVAILRLDAQAFDALVCLPLADDDLAQKGMVVCSLGFPDWRYEPETMSAFEMLQVNESRGTIQLLPNSDKSDDLGDRLRSRLREINGLNAELMLVSAKMWHGVSGGPVVTEQGLVIGLNVRGFDVPLPENLQSKNQLFPKKEAALVNNLAVPIASAKKLLAENHITPDLGPTTQLWTQGLELYRRGRYAEASGKFREVAERQKIALAETGTPQGAVKKPYEAQPGPVLAERQVVNLYVQEMLDRSLAKMAAERN